MKVKYLYVVAIGALSCKMLPDSNRRYADGKGNMVYRLRLSPAPESRYYYNISNESEMKLTIGEKKVDNVNRSQTGVLYSLNKDSAGNLLLDMTYDKIHLYSRNENGEMDLDAAKAATSEDPMEKMLGALTSTHILATVSPMGSVKSVRGYQEMTDKIISGFVTLDENARRATRARLEKMIGEGLIRRNMDQLFTIFPDSAVHVGDKWKLHQPQQGELSLDAKGSFTLVKIEDGLALIRVEGEMSSDSAAAFMGYNVTTHLKGKQQGEYEMDAQTGMLISARISANVEGTIELMGREIPLSLDMNLKMSGRKD